MTTPISLPASALREAFAVLGKLMPNRSTLAVLHHVHIELVENRAILSATDLDHSLSFTHRLEPDPLTPLARTLAALRWKRDAGALLVPRDDLRNALKAVDKDGHVTFTPEGENTLHLSYPMSGQTVNTTVDTLPAADFPGPSEVKAASSFWFDAATRASLVEADGFSSSDKTRYVLCGVFLESVYADAPCPPTLVATDGRRLYRRTVSCAGLEANCIIPSAVIGLLGTPALLAHDARFSLSENGELGNPTHFALAAGPWKLSGKLIEGNFPNYRQVIPTESASTARLGPSSHKLLLELLGKLPPPPKGKAHSEAVTLRFHADRLGVEDKNTKATVVVPGVTCMGKPKIISLNRYFLRELLATGPGIFHVIDEMSPLRYQTTRRAEHVLMPMRVA